MSWWYQFDEFELLLKSVQPCWLPDQQGTEQTWRKDSSSESSFEISSKSPDLLVKDIQGGRRVDDESMNE